MKVRSVYELFRDAVKDFMADRAPRLGASVAFYTIFSLSPLLVIVLAIANFAISDNAAAKNEIISQVTSLIGEKGGEIAAEVINQPEKEKRSIVATLLAAFTLILGSTGVFMELQAALNTIWEVKQEPGAGVWGFIKHRLLSFAMVLTIGFLLVVSLVITAGISAFGKFMGGWMPQLEAFTQILNFVASFGIITLLFAFIFKYMPDVRMPWRDVWIGAAFTSLLFSLGKLGLGLYLGKSTTASAFGAAGSLVIVLMWVYYSSQILFFGAELTQVYAKQRGSKIVPKRFASIDYENSEKDDSPIKAANQPLPGLASRDRRPAPKNVPQRGGLLTPGLILVAALVVRRFGRKSGV